MPVQSIHLLTRELLRISREFYQRGWSSATSGNYSARASEDRLLITASGQDKGELNEADIIVTDLNGNSIGLSAARPSAETRLHTEIYHLKPDVGSVLHVHSPYATVLSMLPSFRHPVELQGYEMLKAFDGVTTHEHTERVPVFPNDQNLEKLAKTVGDYVSMNSEAHGLLITGHGLYSWGKSIGQAKRQVEALEFLFKCEYLRRLAPR